MLRAHPACRFAPAALVACATLAPAAHAAIFTYPGIDVHRVRMSESYTHAVYGPGFSFSNWSDQSIASDPYFVGGSLYAPAQLFGLVVKDNTSTTGNPNFFREQFRFDGTQQHVLAGTQANYTFETGYDVRLHLDAPSPYQSSFATARGTFTYFTLEGILGTPVAQLDLLNSANSVGTLPAGDYRVRAEVTGAFSELAGTRFDHFGFSQIELVPSPGAVALLGIAGMALRRRRPPSCSPPLGTRSVDPRLNPSD